MAFWSKCDCSINLLSDVGFVLRLSPGGANGAVLMVTSNVALSGNSSFRRPTSHGPRTVHNTCVSPMVTMALPEHALDGQALPQSVVEGRAPR
jgi:hypothetical protein